MSNISMTKIDFTNGQGNPINDTNLNAIQDNAETAINEVQGNVDDTLEITTGTGTLNNTYVSSAENNHWERVGKVVSFAFTVTVGGTWDYTTGFISGLPKPVANTRFSGVNSSNANAPVMRFIIGTNGVVQNAYSQETPTAGQTIEGQITYITSE